MFYKKQGLLALCELPSSTPVFARSVLHIFSFVFSVVFLFCALCLMLSVSLQFDPGFKLACLYVIRSVL